MDDHLQPYGIARRHAIRWDAGIELAKLQRVQDAHPASRGRIETEKTTT